MTGDALCHHLLQSPFSIGPRRMRSTMTQLLSTFTIMLLIAMTNGQKWPEKVIKVTWEQDNMDVHLIQNRDKGLAKALQKEGLPVTQTTVNFFILKSGKLLRNCPRYFATTTRGSERGRLMRTAEERQWFQKQEKYFSLYVMDTRDELELPDLLLALNQSIWNCTNQYIDLGALNLNNRLLFINENFEKNDEIYESKLLKAHPNVAIAKLIDEERNVWGLYKRPFHLRTPILTSVARNDETQLRRSAPNIFAAISNFQGVNLRVGALPYERDVIRDPLSGELWGVGISLLELYLRARNASATFNSDERFFGTIEDGIWNGQFGQIYKNQVDLSITPFPNFFGFAKIFGTSLHFFYDDGYAMAAPLPSELPKILATIYPFQLAVWIGILAFFLATSTTIWLLGISAKKLAISPNSSANFEPSLGNCVWLCWCTLMREPLPNSLGHRLSSTLSCLVLPWLLMSLIIMSAYGGSVKSFLINPGQHKPINSLEDLLHQDNLEWRSYALGSSSSEGWTRHSDPMVRLVYSKMKIVDFEPNFEQKYLRDVMEGKYVLVSHSSGLDFPMRTLYRTRSGESLVHLVHLGDVRNWHSQWLLHKLNPFETDLATFMRALNDYGLIEETIVRVDREARFKFIMDGQRDYSDLVRSGTIPLSLNETQGIFLVPGVLVLVCLLVLTAEMRFKANRKGSKTHNN